MRRNHAVRGIYGVTLLSPWQHCEHNVRGRNAMPGGRLYKRSVHRWHGFAAILRAMTVRRARHRFAALHRLFRRCRGTAVKCVRRESDRQYRQKNWLSQTHPWL